MAKLPAEGAFAVYPLHPEWLGEFRHGRWVCVVDIRGRVRDPSPQISLRHPYQYDIYLPGTPEWEACLVRLMTKIMKG
jgi:hypothetical protein